MTDSSIANANRSGDPVADELEVLGRTLDSNPEQVLSRAEQMLRTAPDPRVFRLAAKACRRMGLASDAEDAELAGIQAAFQVEELNRAAVTNRDGRTTESRELVNAYLARHPDDLLALTMAAEADIRAWEIECANERLNVVLGRAPHFLRAIMLRAKYLALQARLREAIEVVEEVIERKPNNRTALQYIAELHAEANDHEKAVEVYGKVLALDPNDVPSWIIQAQQLRMLGRKNESIAAFRRALSLDPCSGPAWWGLVNYFPSAITAQDVAAIERALSQSEATADDGGPLHIALGIIAERRGDHAQAFDHIAIGKGLRAMAQPYDSDAVARNVTDVIETFTAELFAARAGYGFPDAAPIFIVGMPRSGTTLLERILSSHSKVEAGGELPIMPRLHESLRRGDDAAYLHRIAALSGDDLTRLGATYVERSRDYRLSDKPRFIDKLNSNWLHVGLIRMILPNARIIDLRRNALDCCWSNFKMLFAAGFVAANDQRDIAAFYKDYVRMVEAVSSAAPGGILNVRYEDLVDDVEGQTRRIFDFLGLEFEPGCLDFHLSTTAVATPSSEQVRRPINREGIGSAEPYRQWLGPMIYQLGDLAA
jgi:tetratricopeptide (TPR) repeat protein